MPKKSLYIEEPEIQSAILNAVKDQITEFHQPKVTFITEVKIIGSTVISSTKAVVLDDSEYEQPPEQMQ